MIHNYQLFQCWTAQPTMRVAMGRSLWARGINIYNVNPEYKCDWNLREVLNDEVVVEFDTEDKGKAYEGINFTAINLFKEGFIFEVWDHGGKSPHLHIRNLPIAHLEKDKLREFKKLFIRKYVPEEYLDCVDFSLCGIHLIAVEGVKHWKKKYGVKRLLHKFEGIKQ